MNAIKECEIRNVTDENGNPTGGQVTGCGIHIKWQDGPLGDGITFPRNLPNGAFVETVISAALQRLEFFQASKFHCLENENAIKALELALEYLESRTKNRQERKVEGTHEV